MFKLDLSPTYAWPVTFFVPSAEGSRMEEHGFDALFKRFSAEQITELGARAAKQKLSDAAMATEMLAGWKGITDAEGRDVPFTASNAARVLGVPGVAAAVLTAFFGSQGKAAEKN